MFYFLCEGEKGKAEYTFIKNVINEFHNQETYELLAAGGSNHIQEDVDWLINNTLRAGDVFILFFDNVEDINGVVVADLLDDWRISCDERGVTFRHTTYYCFEELFLSYIGLVDMLSLKYVGCKKELHNLQMLLLSGQNYWEESDLSFWVNMFPNLKSATTREQFSARLLTLLTNNMRGNFRITKAVVGLCWIKDCSNLQSVSQISKRVSSDRCASCKYDCKNCTFRKKLRVLDANSVSKLSLPFSTIFDQ